ncbi:MAG TPA: methyltransferase domain-containing protein [Candidatus Methylomirabilis sp.]|nr:methyltransferase domain-containing protein [Candidatus Methylomirabilis sp.]
MGVSDRHYFAWLTGALARFERESGELAAIGAGGGDTLWVLAGARLDPGVTFVRAALGGERTTTRWLDRFARGPGVTAADFNALGGFPDAACDVLLMTRASYLIADPAAFLRDTRRMLRPGGLMIIDWLHGAAEAPRLDLPGHHEYEGRAWPFLTTYADAESLAEFGGEFDGFIRHANRPPSWVDLERPGRRVSIGRRVRHLLEKRPPDGLTRATYLDALRGSLGRAGKHLVEPDALETHFKVVFRDARYLYPLTRKFHLHLLTVLRRVGHS